VADIAARRRTEAAKLARESGGLEKEAAKLRREIDRLVNALATTDEKPDAMITGIAERQARVRDLEARSAMAKLVPDAIDKELEKVREVAEEAIERFRLTLESNPEQARDVVRALFPERITFTPIKTTAGPRYRIEGAAHVGRLLGVEGSGDNVVSPGGHRGWCIGDGARFPGFSAMARRDDPGGGGSGADDGGGRLSAHAEQRHARCVRRNPASGRQWGPLLRLNAGHPEGHEQLIELGNTHERRGGDLDPDRGALRVEVDPQAVSRVRGAHRLGPGRARQVQVGGEGPALAECDLEVAMLHRLTGYAVTTTRR
jgi:hypothetical protein